ncbi:MAG: hypothetical protein IKK26_03375, partial [Clostridia bacterium]|nr:hypothetical protein [Clostridia bacterium]
MKRIISVFCVVVYTVFWLSSCKGNEGDMGASEKEDYLKGDSYTLYVGVYQDHDALEGKAKFSSTFAAIICDKKGRIVDCVFDATEDNISIEDGAVLPKADLRSKNEQGLEYSMKSASAIGKEWYEQARHFADFLIGKTLDEADEVDGGEAELMAGCTININGFKGAIEEADDQENSVRFQSALPPVAAISVVNSSEGSKDAGDNSDGVVAMRSTYAAVAKSGSRIAAANIEETETKAYFDMEGEIKSLEKSEGKRDLGYSYGMRDASGIGLEWFEQVQNFEKYIVGLSSNEVAAINMNGDYSADEELLAGC